MLLDRADSERFWAKIDKNGPDGCWLWRGSIIRGDYLVFSLHRKMRVARRIMWQVTHGPIEEGYSVFYNCGNPICINPAHLFLDTFRVRANSERLKERFWKKVQRGEGEDDCWVWKSAFTDRGYGAFHIEGKPIRAHRASWLLTYGHIPDNLLVLHRCDNPACVRPSHLFLGTHWDNVHDCEAKGRRGYDRIRGSYSTTAILTEQEVAEIRRRYLEGDITQKELAELYRVSDTAIWQIVHHRTWKHVK
jgi:hypothetical protein